MADCMRGSVAYCFVGVVGVVKKKVLLCVTPDRTGPGIIEQIHKRQLESGLLFKPVSVERPALELAAYDEEFKQDTLALQEPGS